MERMIIQYAGMIETGAMHISFALVAVIYCTRMVVNEVRRDFRNSGNGGGE